MNADTSSAIAPATDHLDPDPIDYASPNDLRTSQVTGWITARKDARKSSKMDYANVKRCARDLGLSISIVRDAMRSAGVPYVMTFS